MPDLPLTDITLHYELAGDGPPLLMIPGMLSDHASWLPLIDHLSRDFTLILPDPRGAGRTTPWDAPITLAALATDMLALLDHLGHGRAAVLGHSMGGLVGLALAGRAPDRVRHLVTLASTPLPSARIPAIFSALCATRAAAPDSDAWLRGLFPWLFADAFFRDRDAVDAAVRASLDYPHAQSLAAMRHQTRALARLDLDSLPNRLDVPALALLAEADALIAPAAAGRALAALGAQVDVLEGLAHSAHWDSPHTVADKVAAFCA